MNRAQRKRVTRSLEKARKDLARGPGESPQEMSCFLELEQYTVTLDTLVSGLPAGQKAAKITDSLMAITERAEQEARRFFEPASLNQIACAAGCAWCCHEPLQVSVLDAISVARHLLRTGGGDLSRLEEYSRRLESEFGYERERLKGCFWACPFLEVSQRLCSLYESRPVICRAFHSLDVYTCERHVRQGQPDRSVPMHLSLMGFVGLPLEGAHRALKEISVDVGPVVLGPAVALLLRDFDNTVQAWLAGEAAFESVQVA